MVEIKSGADLEAFVTDFFNTYRNAQARFQMCTDIEQENNDKTQDLLHTIELNPDKLEGVDVVRIFHDIREERREAKKELQIAKVFFDWCNQNKKSLDTLQQVLGEMRKVLRWQPLAQYGYKTDVLGCKDQWLTRKTEPTYEQMTIDQWMYEAGLREPAKRGGKK